ncbi:winged helix DNA-binding domain-containing protein [Nostocoides sp. F2B08]|uniref:winged helix DNA-binding domain-containing protein n=1 Tax=Nostocoides sp. F2B08 TaxID=2653936 RepID=UPI001262ED08|nr:winged helix DNA-binding domain-containing protein [Tetrasphaera sp. F2B08]KAB7745329.1 winged helix DNA-binding domain-containing protein [Tetrasphaera sp. F2B08]
MSAPPLVTDDQRRARIAVRHRLVRPHRAASVEDVTEAMVALHATEPATVYLSAAVRGECSVEDVDRALYTDRSVVKQLAMRRTLFGFTRDLLPAALGSASARVAEQQRRLIAKEAERAGIAADGPRWLAAACSAVLDRLADGAALSATELREQLPELAGQLSFGNGTTYGGTINIAPRVLTVLGAEGRIMRADNAGHWRTSRPRWIATEAWFGGSPEPLSEPEGYAVLVARWLRTFGPGTENDLVWWLGSTRSAVRRALADSGAGAVRLEDGRPAWVASEDVGDVPDPGPWAALLPVLDPTAMGWKERDFYLDPADVPYLVDTNGNIGTTAWWCGRVVGGWVQDEDGAVRVILRSDPGPDAVAALEAEAARLTRWFDGVVVSSVYKSHLMKGEPMP